MGAEFGACAMPPARPDKCRRLTASVEAGDVVTVGVDLRCEQHVNAISNRSEVRIASCDLRGLDSQGAAVITGKCLTVKSRSSTARKTFDGEEAVLGWAKQATFTRLPENL